MAMNKHAYFFITVILVALELCVIISVGWAHKPFFSQDKHFDMDHAMVINDPELSQVVYHEVTREQPYLWLAMDLRENQEIYLQIGLPVLERLIKFRPGFALIGPGLPQAHLPFEIPKGMGAKTWVTGAIKNPQFFHEPFTGTDSWILRDVGFSIPQTGRYYVVAFNWRFKPGKLWLSVGTKEKWGPEDFVKMGEIGKQVRAFHEVAEDVNKPVNPQTEENTMQPLANEQTLVQYSNVDNISAWTIVNDGVMGGVSRGEMALTKNGTAVFSGLVSLDNNGGFTSVQLASGKYDLGEYNGIALRCRGDGKRYKFSIRLNNNFDNVMYQASFETENNKWAEYYLPFKDFIPTYHGSVVKDAGVLDAKNIHSFGLLIADSQAGPFNLEIDWIKAKLVN